MSNVIMTFRRRPAWVALIIFLLPMVLEVNIDFIGRDVDIGGPSTQWRSQLATALAGGLAFATL